MNHSVKPKRQKIEDRLLHPKSSPDQIRCDLALGPFDEAVNRASKRWGVDRLMEIVSPESADKWARAMAGLNESIQNDDPDKTKAWVDVCLRGLKAMDDEAVKSGQPISDPMIWEYKYEGSTYGIIEDGRHWPAAYDKRPGLVIFNMREVAVALHERRNGLVDAVKLAFPGAEVTAVRKVKQDMDDEIENL